MSEPLNPIEQKAMESLISAVLHQFGAGESVSDKEIDEFLNEGYSLSDEQKTALGKLGTSHWTWITAEAGDCKTPVIREQTAELAGMYRHGSDKTLDSETRKLLEEKRKEIINRLRKNKEKS